MPSSKKSWVKRALTNLALLFVSVVVFVVFCELVLFRYVLKPADFEANDYKNEVVRYAPNQKGVYRLMDEIEAPFSINADGWNSRRDHYDLERRDGVRRIAVVGDSYVHAREVPFDQSFPELLEDRMNADGPTTEVFRFGIKGAPLSQYLQMIRKEVLAYRPDVIVVLLIHNDFDESFIKRNGRYINSFLHLDVEDGKVVGEIQPKPYQPNWVDWLSQTSTFGYLYHRERIDSGVDYVAKLFYGGRGETNFEANIDVDKTKALMNNIAATMDYVFADFAKLSAESGIKFVLVMDGHRDGIYEGRALEPGSTTILELNALAAKTAARYSLPFLDLHPAFLADWQANGRRFNFQNDGHWNLYGHQLVAAEIEKFLSKQDIVQISEKAGNAE